MSTILSVLIILVISINLILIHQLFSKDKIKYAKKYHEESYSNLDVRIGISKIIGIIYSHIQEETNKGNFYIEIDNPIDKKCEHYESITRGIVSHLRYEGFLVDIRSKHDNTLIFTIKW